MQDAPIEMTFAAIGSQGSHDKQHATGMRGVGHSLCSEGSVADVLHERLVQAVEEGGVAHQPFCVANPAQNPEETWHGQRLNLKTFLFRECGQRHLQQQERILGMCMHRPPVPAAYIAM